MSDPLGLPTPVPKHPGYELYEVAGGEDVAVFMRIGKGGVLVDIVPCNWAMEVDMPRIVGLVEDWKWRLGQTVQEDDSEPEPPVLNA